MQTPEISQVPLRDVFIVIFKHKYKILLFFFAVVIAVTVGTFIVKPTYKASAQILVKLGRESMFVPLTSDTHPIVSFNRDERVNSEIEILKSRSLAEKVVSLLGPTVLYEGLKNEEPGIAHRILAKILPDDKKNLTSDEKAALNFEIAIEEFQKALNIEGIKKSSVIAVNFEHKDPRMAAMVVNNLANAYLDRHLEVHKSPQNVQFFQEQAEILKNKLEMAEQKLKNLKKKHSITSLEEQRSLLLRQATDAHTALNQTQSQQVETEKRIAQLRQQLAVTPKTISQGEESDQNPYLINTLEARLVELELQEKELLGKYTDQSRRVQHVREEIRIVKTKLAEQEKKSYGRKRSGVNPTYQNLQQELFRNEAELQALKAKRASQMSQHTNFQQKLEQLNQVELELEQLEQEVEVDRENYRLYLTKFEESRISDAMDAEKITSVRLISPARPPRKPVSPKVMLNLLIAFAVGTFGGFGRLRACLFCGISERQHGYRGSRGRTSSNTGTVVCGGGKDINLFTQSSQRLSFNQLALVEKKRLCELKWP